MTAWAYLWMLLSAVSFAAMGALAHAVRDEADWQIIALARVVVTLIVYAAAAGLTGVRLHVWRPKHLWLRSIAGSVSMLCIFYALVHIPVSITLTLAHLYPLWVALLSWPLLRQIPTKGVWLAAAMGFAGVALIEQPQLAAGNYASLAALAASFTAALAAIALHRLRGVPVPAIVVHFSVVGLICLLPAFFLFDAGPGPRVVWNGRSSLLLLGVGMSAVVGQLSLTLAFTLGRPDRVAIVGLTQVGFAMLFDVLIWNHAFDALSATGIILVVAPTAWVMRAGPEAIPAAERVP